MMRNGSGSESMRKDHGISKKPGHSMMKAIIGIRSISGSIFQRSHHIREINKINRANEIVDVNGFIQKK